MAVTDAEQTVTEQIPPADDPAGQGWRQDGQQRWYVPARGRSGVVFRQGNETIEEAHARDAQRPKDKPPKKKPAPKRTKPPAPTKIDLKQLEWELTEALKSPAFAAGLAGDEWVVWHVEKEAPILARNLVAAAEHNPWLREKLEAAAMGGDVMLYKVVSALSVAGALIAYAIPPAIYYGLPVPAGAREIFKVPDRRQLKREQEAVRAAQQMREEAERAAAQAAQQAASGAGPDGFAPAGATEAA